MLNSMDKNEDETKFDLTFEQLLLAEFSSSNEESDFSTACIFSAPLSIPPFSDAKLAESSIEPSAMTTPEEDVSEEPPQKKKSVPNTISELQERLASIDADTNKIRSEKNQAEKRRKKNALSAARSRTIKKIQQIEQTNELNTLLTANQQHLTTITELKTQLHVANEKIKFLENLLSSIPNSNNHLTFTFNQQTKSNPSQHTISKKRPRPSN